MLRSSVDATYSQGRVASVSRLGHNLRPPHSGTARMSGELANTGQLESEKE
jgi:hypothetical protein